jgi:D-cysteine desulfhydrase family pyridoxal phosphate-dependent enzyme
VLSELPRIRLAQLPTPLEEAKRLSAALGGPRIFFKRDDLTAAGLGGNKVRKLEFVIGRALAEGADSLVVCGGYQSNLARVAAALGSRLGLKVELVLGGISGEAHALTGNLLLDHIYGAGIRYVETTPRWDFGSVLEEVMTELQAQGRRPFLMPLGGSTPEGMAGYVLATAEILGQCSEAGIAPCRLYVAVGSGGTYCGLLLGALNASASYDVVGVSVSRSAEYLREKIPLETGTASSVLGLKRSPVARDLQIEDRYVGAEYGALTQGCLEAIALVARTEGVLLDPVYSGKAMAGLIDHIRRGVVGPGDTVLFLHTGGGPALFAYSASELGIGPAPQLRMAPPRGTVHS